MFNTVVSQSIGLLSNKVQNDPIVIVKPIATFLGYILNFIFNIAHSLTEKHSLGLSIIFFTIVVRFLMVPLAIKQQKSMSGMQKLQPEMKKIKKKYGSTKDPEIQKKMNAEMQALYAKEGVNPLSGCLPLLIQFPIFIALSFIMQQSFAFIDKLGAVYHQIAEKIMAMPDWINGISTLASFKIIKGHEFVIDAPGNLEKILNKFTLADWNTYLGTLPSDVVAQITPLLTQKDNMEFFLGINLLDSPGWMFPGIIIPILSALTTFLSTWIMTRQTKPTDDNAKMQQKMMIIIMPIMMGYFAISLPVGVGLYWISSSVFQLCQQIILNRYFSPFKSTNKKEA